MKGYPFIFNIYISTRRRALYSARPAPHP